MVRCRALYSKAHHRPPRGRIELEPHVLRICLPDGRCRSLFLNGARFAVRDAARNLRFVRHLKLYLRDGRADLITPPDEGAIAPRAAQLPGVPDDAIIVDRQAFDAVVDWLEVGGKLSGRTIAELARLASVASAAYAVTVGEWAGQVAMDMTWERRGPLRGGSDMRHPLRPLEEAAVRHPRAAEALIAALSHTSVMRRAG